MTIMHTAKKEALADEDPLVRDLTRTKIYDQLTTELGDPFAPVEGEDASERFIDVSIADFKGAVDQYTAWLRSWEQGQDEQPEDAA